MLRSGRVDLRRTQLQAPTTTEMKSTHRSQSRSVQAEVAVLPSALLKARRALLSWLVLSVALLRPYKSQWGCPGDEVSFEFIYIMEA